MIHDLCAGSTGCSTSLAAPEVASTTLENSHHFLP